mgnify:FL=1
MLTAIIILIKVGMRDKLEVLHAPTDIEGHIGSDGRYYVLDTARIAPPEPPQKSFIAVVIPEDERSVKSPRWSPLNPPYGMCV